MELDDKALHSPPTAEAATGEIGGRSVFITGELAMLSKQVFRELERQTPPP